MTPSFVSIPKQSGLLGGSGALNDASTGAHSTTVAGVEN
jgi:hypothetical protein